MIKPWRREIRNADEFGRDMELAGALEALDPARGDPNYWLRFRGWVVASAAGELARRRLMARITVGDVVTSWARTVVPTALAAAAVAAVLLLRADSVPAAPQLGPEERFLSEIEGAEIPRSIDPDGSGDVFAFAAEVF